MESCDIEAVLVVGHGPEIVTKVVAMTVSKIASSAAFWVGKDSGSGSEIVTKVVAMTVSKTASFAAFGVGKDSGSGAGGPLYELIQDTC